MQPITKDEPEQTVTEQDSQCAQSHNDITTAVTMWLANYTHPEFYKEEGILGTFSVQLLQSSFLFWEFVINLTNVYRLQQGVGVGMICLSDMYK